MKLFNKIYTLINPFNLVAFIGLAFIVYCLAVYLINLDIVLLNRSF